MTLSSVCAIQWNKKAIKISVSQHHRLYDTDDLVKFRKDGMNFSICWETDDTRVYCNGA